ncbi:MAG: nuclear transport factor 2 family protein [Pyrinomonadaceae bacterium]|nr:nuclear transport factor 2 family protein [Pyrinomonadaceae bacterium]
MKQFFHAAVLIIVSVFTAAGQTGDAEQEVRAFFARYDKAVADRDIHFLESVLAEEYVYNGAGGRATDRARFIAFFKRVKEKPAYRTVELVHDNIWVRVVGNMAVATNDYMSRTAPIDQPDAEPQTTRGRHMIVFEKRDGRWMVIAEQDTEQPNDDKLAEQQVRRAGREYNELMKRLKSGRSFEELEKAGDIAALRNVLADEYLYTSRDGEVSNKTEDIDGYRTNRIRLTSAEHLDQKVRVVDNNTAVETGAIRYIGTNNGVPFDITKRYTTTWVSWSGRWRIIADHTSMVKPK